MRGPAELQRLVRTKESYTLTCEAPTGEVLETKAVQVDRGQRLTLDLACGVKAPVVPPVDTSKDTPTQDTPTDTAQQTGGATTGGQTQTQTQGSTTTKPVLRPGLSLVREKLTARIINRRKAFRVRVRAFNGTLRNVRMEVRDAAGRRGARGTLGSIAVADPVTLKRAGRIRPGLHTITVTALGADGRLITRRLTVRIG